MKRSALTAGPPLGRAATTGVWRGALVVALLSLAAACRPGQPQEATISAERFIEANVALRQIDRETPEADSLRQAALAEHGVTEEDLRDFVEVRGDRPLELAEIWHAIHQRLVEETAEGDPVPAVQPDTGTTFGPLREPLQPAPAEADPPALRTGPLPEDEAPPGLRDPTPAPPAATLR